MGLLTEPRMDPPDDKLEPEDIETLHLVADRERELARRLRRVIEEAADGQEQVAAQVRRLLPDVADQMETLAAYVREQAGRLPPEEESDG